MIRCALALALSPTLALTLALAPAGPVRAATPPPAADLAFVGAHVIPMTGPFTLNDHTVIVRDGTIAAVGPDAEVTPAPTDRVIDATGLTIVPGLAEMHAHVPLPDARGMPDGYREDVLALWAANGVTLARGMLGHPSHLELRSALAAHEVLGPRLVTSGPSLNGNSVSSPAQARAMVAAQAEAGYDFVKLHPGLAADELDAVAEAAEAAGLPFAGHVSRDPGLRAHLAAGQATIDHLDGYLAALVPEDADVPAGAADFFGLGLAPFVDESRIPDLVAATREAGTAVVPTETLLENVAGAVTDLDAVAARPENAYLPPALRRGYLDRREDAADADIDPEAFLALRKRLLKALADGGVPVLLGSDSPQVMNVPGFSIHRELEAYVAAGLHPMQALATGTANAATFLGETGRSGAVVEGAGASFVLLRRNPIVDIARTREIEGVMLRGRWLDRAFLDDTLEDIRTRYGR
jgi:imidazolonepropionase-like amidohydrolase